MKYNTLATQESTNAVVTALQNKGVDVQIVETKIQALDAVKKIIPQGASVMNGSSVTLEQIGYLEYLDDGTHGWIDLHKPVAAESDPAKRAALRKQALTSDYYLGSVHALTQTGEYIIGSNTGSQIPHVAFTSQNLIFVVGTQKIVATLSDGMKRLEEYVVPLEDDHMKRLYNSHTQLNKILISKGEAPMLKRQIHFILVKEPLGF